MRTNPQAESHTPPSQKTGEGFSYSQKDGLPFCSHTEWHPSLPLRNTSCQPVHTGHRCRSSPEREAGTSVGCIGWRGCLEYRRLPMASYDHTREGAMGPIAFQSTRAEHLRTEDTRERLVTIILRQCPAHILCIYAGRGDRFWLVPFLKQACSWSPMSAICVQNFDDSLSPAIHTRYRISLRSSSLREPRYPLLRVVFGLFPVEYDWRIHFDSA